MQCNERDHHVLLNFKHTLVDPSAILPTWSDERDCCEWEGVRGVTVLNLRSNYFGGGFPEGLLNLRKTQELAVGTTDSVGQFPDWLGQLQHLQLHDLSENFFSGPVPSTLGNISSLKTFIIRSNHSSGALPANLGQLLNLRN
ncbi:receptor-like protein 35 [Neltuma alba]|uniref:receptor-like protein 35 n=1 Tax=Neltuma alba TaxID=207710 RepID=UPI0010A409B9|nr:receptor-like protein 35 [Prosopis alba]